MSMLNWNVRLALWFTFFSTAARQIWAFVTLSLYLKSLTGKNLSVGVSEGVQGALQALTAITVGWYIDAARRDTGMRIAGSVGILAIGFTLFSLIVSDDELHTLFQSGNTAQDRYILMTTALSFWGMYQGVWNTVLETIYADSITTGNRSDFNTRKFMLLQLASIVGPLIALILFLEEGDTWYHMTLRLVFIVGVSLCTPGAIMLFFFNDDHSLGDESEAVSAAPSRNGHTSRINSSNASGSAISGTGTGGKGGGRRDSADSSSHHPEEDRHTSQVLNGVLESVQALSTSGDYPMVEKRRWGCLTSSKIPHILVFSDLISGLASGMTIKFFPLFFARKVWLSPVAVQGIYIALPIFMITTSFAAQRVSQVCGRVVTSVGMAYIGSGALCGLWAILTYKTDWQCHECPWHDATNKSTCEAAVSSAGHPYCSFKVTGKESWTCTPVDCGIHDYWYYILILYFLSTFQHCCRPLKKSILMDYTRKSTRGRWNSLDSVTRFGWSGSAVLGGYIIDRWDYGASFLATAIMQILSATILFALLPLLGTDHERARDSPSPVIDDDGGPDVGEAGQDEDELAPLLPRAHMPNTRDRFGGRRNGHEGHVQNGDHADWERLAATRATSAVSMYE
eukprot:m.169300 g.169300  ORF g.169300 m.169300 type:complete len:624 (-) comp13085_c0_seq1:115-1986(-)